MISKQICTTLKKPNPKKQLKLTLVFGKPQHIPPPLLRVVHITEQLGEVDDDKEDIIVVDDMVERPKDDHHPLETSS